MVFSPSILSAKEVVCPLNEKFLFGPQYAMINSVFFNAVIGCPIKVCLGAEEPE